MAYGIQDGESVVRAGVDVYQNASWHINTAQGSQARRHLPPDVLQVAVGIP